MDAVELADALLPPGGDLIVLPAVGPPRLAMRAEGSVSRWRASAAYQASTLPGEVRRLGERALAALGGGRRVRTLDEWAAPQLVPEPAERAVAGVAFIAPPGPVQKVTARLDGDDGEPIAFVKAGGSPGARERIAAETDVLRSLSAGLGPAVLGAGRSPDFDWVALEAIKGEWIERTPRPSADLVGVLDALAVPQSSRVFEDHPHVRHTGVLSESSMRNVVRRLSDREWPVVFMHGDVAPWNCLKTPQGVRLIDWEYGSSEGMPYVDMAYYVLQVAYFVRKWSPSRALAEATAVLTQRVGEPGLADSLVRYACFGGYVQELRDGRDPSDRQRTWRRAIWTE